MKNNSDRRRAVRWPTRLLAKCFLDQDGITRTSDMWVKDVNENGLRLETPIDPFSVPARTPTFHRGEHMVIHHLFYDEHGPHAVSGSIRWARRSPEGGIWSVGVKLGGEARRNDDRSPVFHDFLEVVKAP